MNIVYQTKIGINIILFWKSILSFIPGLIAPIAMGIIIKKFIEFDTLMGFCGWILIYTVVYIVSMWLLGLNEYEKMLIKAPLRKFMRNIRRVYGISR